MKTKKLSLNQISGVLSREQMKKIMAGSGPCQTWHSSCDTNTDKNCCSSLVCAGNVCRNPTLSDEE